eukprot:420603-Prorocentrum_minimum.AAC.1
MCPHNSRASYQKHTVPLLVSPEGNVDCDTTLLHSSARHTAYSVFITGQRLAARRAGPLGRAAHLREGCEGRVSSLAEGGGPDMAGLLVTSTCCISLGEHYRSEAGLVHYDSRFSLASLNIERRARRFS